MCYMSVCFKCDVCGKLYEPYTSTKIKPNSIMLSGTHNGIPGSRHEEIDYFDLCQDCLNKILAIIPYTEEEEEDDGNS